MSPVHNGFICWIVNASVCSQFLLPPYALRYLQKLYNCRQLNTNINVCGTTTPHPISRHPAHARTHRLREAVVRGEQKSLLKMDMEKVYFLFRLGYHRDAVCRP